ncbi:EAL domain-containing protein [Bradyrhizobium uaiense]|uniref:EAL domain-containing protein n=1 Tax=Bradyrhizobium uaiense TaxID=2594946 RepID=A0A6P1BAS6_9BRAD|nr:EAL domain-containing protein [Bradyrhizobium uaiense]NEU95294.1 EAL domain-containing protein [Bradyrhizobium uaiense]
MPTYTKLESGSWRVQVRRKRQYVANTFIRRRDAEEWAIEAERSIDRGTPVRRFKSQQQPRIFSDLIALHLDDLAEVGKPGAACISALEEGRLCFAYQPVCSSNRPDEILYWECLLHIAGSEPASKAMGAAISILERTELIRGVHHWVVSRAIDELLKEPQICLGCNISARSAVLDAQWLPIIAKAARHPHVARRLILEVTVTTPLPDHDETQGFIRTLQALGCRIAVDDVGARSEDRYTLVSAGPDFIKLDARILHAARLDREGRSHLSEVVSVAARLSKAVIALGCETPEDLRIARLAGVAWIQGGLLGSPAISRDRIQRADDDG